MTRRLFARALGVLLAALSATLVWNAFQEFRYATGIGYAVAVLQLMATPLAALAAYRLWRGDRRAPVVAGAALAIATAAGALAAWTYTPEPDRSSAAFGALGGGIVFTIAVVLLARISLRSSSPEPISPVL
ncbi:MAG: hypothetical protein ACT4P6_00610 [Gemmatimonadaceae bacterium]